MARQWRRRNRRLFLTLGAVFTAIGVAANAGALYYHRWNWGAGLMTGVLVAIFVALRQEPPAHIEQWEVGAWGEQRTAKALRRLDARSWKVIHDLPAARGNFDHVVIGPPGVFLLDTKNWHGAVTIESDMATLRRLEDPDLSCVFDGLPRRMRGLAVELQQRYKDLGLRAGWVTPVVVVWARFPQQIVGADKLAYVHGDQVTAWLNEQPERLLPGQIQALHAALLPPRSRRRRLRRLKPEAGAA